MWACKDRRALSSSEEKRVWASIIIIISLINPSVMPYRDYVLASEPKVIISDILFNFYYAFFWK